MLLPMVLKTNTFLRIIKIKDRTVREGTMIRESRTTGVRDQSTVTIKLAASPCLIPLVVITQDLVSEEQSVTVMKRNRNFHLEAVSPIEGEGGVIIIKQEKVVEITILEKIRVKITTEEVISIIQTNIDRKHIMKRNHLIIRKLMKKVFRK